MNDTPSLNHNSPEIKSNVALIFYFFEIIWERRRRIIPIVLTIAIIVAVISLLMTKTFTSQAVIIPPTDMVSDLQQRLGGIQALASATSILGGLQSPTQLYPDILQSETVLKEVIYHKYHTEKYPQPVNLIEYFQYFDEDSVYNYEQCLNKLQGRIMTIDLDRKTFILTLSIETPEKQLSADVANFLCAQLDHFEKTLRKTTASEQRIFLEQRLVEVKQDLRNSEDSLKNFNEKNRQTAQSPDLLLQQSRLSQNVDINTALYLELRKQFEYIRLSEIENTDIVQVMDTARAAARKTSPRRTMMVLFWTFLTFLGCSFWYIRKDYYAKLPDQPEIFINIVRLSRKILGDLRIIRKIKV